jgi:hypothetical protein
LIKAFLVLPARRLFNVRYRINRQLSRYPWPLVDVFHEYVALQVREALHQSMQDVLQVKAVWVVCLQVFHEGRDVLQLAMQS